MLFNAKYMIDPLNKSGVSFRLGNDSAIANHAKEFNQQFPGLSDLKILHSCNK